MCFGGGEDQFLSISEARLAQLEAKSAMSLFSNHTIKPEYYSYTPHPDFKTIPDAMVSRIRERRGNGTLHKPYVVSQLPYTLALAFRVESIFHHAPPVVRPELTGTLHVHFQRDFAAGDVTAGMRDYSTNHSRLHRQLMNSSRKKTEGTTMLLKTGFSWNALWN